MVKPNSSFVMPVEALHFIQQSNNLLVILTAEGKIEWINEAGFEHLNYNPEEIIGKSINNLLHNSTFKELTKVNIDRTKQYLNPNLKTVILKTKKGDKFSYTLDCNSLAVGEKYCLRFVPSPMKLFRSGSDDYHTLFKATPDSLYVIDFDGNILDVNDAACEKIECRPKKEVIGKNLTELVPEEEADDVMDFHKSLIEGSIPDYNRAPLINGKNQLIEVEYRSRIVQFKGTSAVLLIIRELPFQLENERRKEEQYLKSEKRNLAMLEAIPDLMFSLTEKGILLSCTIPESSAHLNSRYQIGTSIYQVYPLDIAQLFEENLLKAKESDQAQIFEFQLPEFESVTCYEVRMALSGENEIFCILRDITEKKEAELALFKHVKELAKSNLELEHFAYVASHDLQEPLRMIISFMQIIESRYVDKLDESAKEFISYAVNGAHRMKKLISDLLNYSRIGNLEIVNKTVNLDSVLSVVLHNLQNKAKEADVSIGLGSLPSIKGEVSQISQLFQNLVENAIKFRKKEGKPIIKVDSQETPENWIISVKDNGIGIEGDYLDHVFGIFKRLHTQEEYQGSGIGLATCKRIMENHQGKIYVESEYGKGTSFYVHFNK